MKDKVHVFEGNKELLPGIRSIESFGHTPGHTSFHVASGSDQLIILGDVTNIPALFAKHPEWHAAFDQDADTAEATRRKLFDRIVAGEDPRHRLPLPLPRRRHPREGRKRLRLPARVTSFPPHATHPTPAAALNAAAGPLSAGLHTPSS